MARVGKKRTPTEIMARVKKKRAPTGISDLGMRISDWGFRNFESFGVEWGSKTGTLAKS